MVEAIAAGCVIGGSLLVVFRTRVARWQMSDFEVKDWRRIEALLGVMGVLIVAAGLSLLLLRATA